jgi:hypothetical protein
MSNSFKTKVVSFIQNSGIRTEADRADIQKEIVRLALHIQTGMGSTTLRRKTFRLNCLDEFTHFKNQYLDMSSYVHRKLWVAVVNYAKDGILPSATSPEEAATILEDVMFCLSILDENDQEKVRKTEVKQALNVDSIDLSTMTTGAKSRKDLISYAKSKAFTLRFLTDHDPGLELEDFEQDLLCEIVRVFNAYPRSKGKNLDANAADNLRLRVEKYLETALNNKVMNLKEYYTCDNRRRVATTDAALYKLKSKLKKLMQKDPNNKEFQDRFKEVEAKIKSSDSDYYSIVTSLVRHEDGEDRVIDVADTNKNGSEEEGVLLEEPRSAEERMWIEQVCTKVSPNIAKFVRIITGEHNKEFEIWAKDQAIDTNLFDSLVKAARKYCDVTKADLLSNRVLSEALNRLSNASDEYSGECEECFEFKRTLNGEGICLQCVTDLLTPKKKPSTPKITIQTAVVEGMVLPTALKTSPATTVTV